MSRELKNVNRQPIILYITHNRGDVHAKFCTMRITQNRRLVPLYRNIFRPKFKLDNNEREINITE